MWHVWSERRIARGVLVGKPDRMRQAGKSRCRWDNNIKTDLQKKNRMSARTGLIWLRTGIIFGLL